MRKLFIKRLTIKTNFDPSNYEDVKKFETACKILESENYDFEKGIETVATEFLKRLYFKYSVTSDFIIWVVVPLVTLILIL
jgi:hypothetical protein